MTKPRLVIAGDDLKFVTPMLPVLRDRYDVRVDQWQGPENHEEASSRALLEWADIIWCEWWLGNAVWYSWNKRPGQHLLVRLHLFELGREYGFTARHEAIDRVVTVSMPTHFDLLRTFPVPPARARIVPNAVDFDAFNSGHVVSRLQSLALVGAVPARKGLRRALEVLRELRTISDGFELHVYGKRPNELPWVQRDPAQMDYFRECDEFVEHHGLTSALAWHGWTDMTTEMGRHGFVLSPSDFESFHVAPVEGAAAGGVPVVWTWPGAHWSHPTPTLVEDSAQAAARIRALSDPAAHERANSEALAWYRARCQPQDVATQLLEGM